MTFEHDSGAGEEEADALVERLVRAGRADGPSPRALVVAPAAVAALLSSQAAAAAAGGQAAALSAAQLGKAAVSPLLVLKWVGAGALASSSALALFSATQSAPTSETRSAASAAPLVRSASVVPGAPVVPQPVLPAAQSVASAPAAPAASAPPADLAREVAALDAARQALIDGNAALALRELSSLEGAPRRALVPEATVLRVRALLAQGDAVQARRVAERFLAVSPSSPQASVLRRLVENSEMQPAGSRL